LVAELGGPSLGVLAKQKYNRNTFHEIQLPFRFQTDKVTKLTSLTALAATASAGIVRAQLPCYAASAASTGVTPVPVASMRVACGRG
jgi:hypothetical protein